MEKKCSEQLRVRYTYLRTYTYVRRLYPIFDRKTKKKRKRSSGDKIAMDGWMEGRKKTCAELDLDDYDDVC